MDEFFFSLKTNNEINFDDLNFDPKSSNYFARRIGDRYVTIDSLGKLTYNGDWNNRSKHIYLSDFSDIANASIPKTLVPMGHAAVNNPFGSDDSSIPAWVTSSLQTNAQGEFDSNQLYGHDYSNADAEEYLAPINGFNVGSNTTMSLEDFNGNADASVTGTTFSTHNQKITLTLSSLKQRKFVVPFQGGFDGDNPANPKYVDVSVRSFGISKNNNENKNNEDVLDCFIENTILFHRPEGLCSITNESILIL